MMILIDDDFDFNDNIDDFADEFDDVFENDFENDLTWCHKHWAPL